MDLNSLRHEKERAYFIIAAVISVLIWLAIIWFAWIYLILVGLVSLITSQYYKAMLYGNAVKVKSSQFAAINSIVNESAAKLKLTTIPEVFVLSGQGALNAVAIRMLTGKYVLLYGELMDLMLQRGQIDEVKMIVGHELAHHALGHVSVWKNLLLVPARIVPLLGTAYSRACELSADRAGMVLSGNPEASRRALLALTLGCKALAEEVDISSFQEQENNMPVFMGFLHEVISTHPRMTRRIIELTAWKDRSLSMSMLLGHQTAISS